MTRVGIIGTGWGARVQAPIFRLAGVDVTAIAGHDGVKTERIASALELQPFVRWEELVASDEVDLVIVTAPPFAHAEMTNAALESGKHVVCEKPTALNSSEASRMLQTATARPRQLALIDHELRFLPTWRRAKDLVPSLGGVRYVEFRYASPSRGDRNRAWNWWSDENRGGGVLGAIGSHAIDAMRYLVGEVEAVQATLHTFVRQRPFENESRAVTSDDFATLSLQLSGGTIASLVMSVVSAADEPTTITIHGETGGIRLAGRELLLVSGGKFVSAAMVHEPPNPLSGDSPGGPFGTATFYFARAIRAALNDGDANALSPAATFRDGLRQQIVLDAARTSARRGGAWVETNGLPSLE